MKINIKNCLKSILFYFCIAAAKLNCKKNNPQPSKEKTNDQSSLPADIDKINKAKASIQNQDIEEPPQSVSEDMDERDNLSQHPENDLNQSKQGLTDAKAINSEKPGPDAAAEKPDRNGEYRQGSPLEQPTQYIVLLHGLAESKDSFYYFEPNLRKALQASGWTNIKFIYPASREGLSSAWSLHVDDVFKEIKNKVGNAPVHLIGYSQGGLVAGQLETEKKYSDQLNIASATYISTPFLGVGAMNATSKEVNEFLNNAGQALDKLAKSQDLDTEKIKKATKRNQALLSFISSWWLQPFTKGLTALNPDNNQNMVENIRSGSKEVPRLVIGGHASFGDLFNISPETAEILDLHYAKLLKKNISPNATLGNNSMKNDTMIPLPSQLARRGSIDQINLAGIGDSGSEIPGPDGCVNTKYYVFPKTAHAWNLPILDASLFIEKESRPVLASPEVASRVADFLSEQMQVASQAN